MYAFIFPCVKKPHLMAEYREIVDRNGLTISLLCCRDEKDVTAFFFNRIPTLLSDFSIVYCLVRNRNVC